MHEDDEDLDFYVEDASGTRTYYKGTPFSGVTYRTFPDGSLLEENTYKDGQQYGPVLSYHGNGKLASRQWYGSLGLTGAEQTWSETGILQSEHSWPIQRICLSERHWDATGYLVRDVHCQPQFEDAFAPLVLKVERHYAPPSGILIKEAVDEFGVAVRKTEWTSTGSLKQTWALSPESTEWSKLEARRAEYQRHLAPKS